MAILMVVDQVADMKTLLPLACTMALARETSLCILRRLPSVEENGNRIPSAGATNGTHAQNADPNPQANKNPQDKEQASEPPEPSGSTGEPDSSPGSETAQNPAGENTPRERIGNGSASGNDPGEEESSSGRETGDSPTPDSDSDFDSDSANGSGTDKTSAADAPADPDAARRDAFIRASDAAIQSIATSLQRAAPPGKVVFLTDEDPHIGLLREMRAREPELTLLPASFLPKQHADEWVHTLSEKTGCDILVCQAKSPIGIPRRILVPVAGGTHGIAALRMTKALLSVTGGEAVCLTVETFCDPDAGEIAAHLARRNLEKAGVKTADPFRAEGVGAPDPHAVIVNRAKDGMELVLVGAGRRKRGHLRGTQGLPQRLLEEEAARMVGVMYRAPGGAGQVMGQIRARLRAMLPVLGRERRIAIFEQMRDGSRFGIDFGLMLALSAAIAALGLAQDSTAVVIGAMLVAPLMTPMIGFALAIVQANIRLAKDCLLSILIGTLIAVGISAVLGGVAGGAGFSNGLTGELLARCGPGVLDLGVAVFSGMAGAYAIARPNLSGAVAGVAIAAALVPPLATTGILLSWGEMSMAKLAFLLFCVNLVAIILGAFLAFRLVGLGRGSASGKERAWPLRTLVFLILAILLFVMVFAYTPPRPQRVGNGERIQREPESDPLPGEEDAAENI